MKYGDARYRQVDGNGEGLTHEEMMAGWHFCLDWDEMLVGPPMTAEWDCCTCQYKNVRHAREHYQELGPTPFRGRTTKREE